MSGSGWSRGPSYTPSYQPPQPIYRYLGKELTSDEVKMVTPEHLAELIKSGDVRVFNVSSSQKTPKSSKPYEWEKLTSSEIEDQEAKRKAEEAKRKDQEAIIKAQEAVIKAQEAEIASLKSSEPTDSRTSHHPPRSSSPDESSVSFKGEILGSFF